MAYWHIYSGFKIRNPNSVITDLIPSTMLNDVVNQIVTNNVLQLLEIHELNRILFVSPNTLTVLNTTLATK